MIQVTSVLLLLVVATEAITELLVKSEFFKFLRKFLFESNNKVLKFIHKILDCGYCTSVWASIFVLSTSYFMWDMVYYLWVILSIHRFSNLFHFLMDKMWDRKTRY